MSKKESYEDKKEDLDIRWQGFMNNFSYLETYVDALYYEGCIEQSSYKVLRDRLNNLLENYKGIHIDLDRTWSKYYD